MSELCVLITCKDVLIEYTTMYMYMYMLRVNSYLLTYIVPKGTPPDGGALSEGSGTEDNVHISSPIRVSPERREPRVVQRSPRCEEDGRLSAKERLYVSKNAIGKYTNEELCTCV